jgi:TPR repeat protein
MERKQRRI